MKIYLAAPWVCKNEAAYFAGKLEKAGHTITEKWWYHPEVESYPNADGSPSDRTDLIAQAQKDITGVRYADVVVVLQLERSEGKAWEQGLAWAEKKPIIVYSPEKLYGNLFQVLARKIVTTHQEVLDELSTMRV